MRHRLLQSCDEHAAIIAAVLAGDAALASERMRAHVNVVRAASVDYVRALGPTELSRTPERRASAQLLARSP